MSDDAGVQRSATAELVMKRAHGHLAFALVAAALGVLTAGEALRLRHAQRINMSVAEWATTAP